MIIFYYKKTGEIIGIVGGRAHDKVTLKNVVIKPSGVKASKIGKYVVPFKTKYKRVKEPVIETRIVDKKTMRVENVVVGHKKVKRGVALEPDVPFADLILDFELGKQSIYDYKISLGKKGEVEGLEKAKQA